MKKGLIITIAIIVALGLWGITGFNSLVSMEEGVDNQWAQVETQYQRRADLIPNLVNTVKGYASHEKETLTGVIEARSKATQMTVNAKDLTPEKLAEFQAAQGQLGAALGRLMALSESYPDLKANEQSMGLQAQLEGTENRIGTSRRDYNEAVNIYNTRIRSFPSNIIANLFGFHSRELFMAQEGAQEVPDVNFAQ